MNEAICPDGYRAFNENGEVISMACDRWNCPVCAKVVAHRYSDRVRYGINLWQPYDAYFWTLTLPGWVHYPKTGFRLLPGIWDRFRRGMQHKVSDWHYAAFVECHPHRQLIPHFHVISLKPAPLRLKDIAVKSGFGYQAWDRQITGRQAAAYVTKYCSKQGYAMPRGFRRVRISQHWPRLPDPQYDLKVYPILPKETVKAYIRRIANITGKDYPTLLTLWLDQNNNTAI